MSTLTHGWLGFFPESLILHCGLKNPHHLNLCSRSLRYKYILVLTLRDLVRLPRATGNCNRHCKPSCTSTTFGRLRSHLLQNKIHAPSTAAHRSCYNHTPISACAYYNPTNWRLIYWNSLHTRTLHWTLIYTRVGRVSTKHTAPVLQAVCNYAI